MELCLETGKEASGLTVAPQHIISADRVGARSQPPTNDGPPDQYHIHFDI